MHVFPNPKMNKLGEYKIIKRYGEIKKKKRGSMLSHRSNKVIHPKTC